MQKTRIAITGPDGSGKSSISDKLSEELHSSVVVYAGKYRNHMLWSTKIGLKIWKSAQKLGGITSFVARFFLFYPLEYFENLKRFKHNYEGSQTIIYDRHPIDRMALRHEINAGNPPKRLKDRIEYSLLSFWSWWYRNFFPVIDRVYVLLPHPSLCFDRSKGQYKNEEEAKVRINAFYKAMKEYKSQNCVPIEIDENLSIDDICNIISQNLKLK